MPDPAPITPDVIAQVRLLHGDTAADALAARAES